MIYVSIQYRLGIFGFLSGSQIAQNGVLNAGLLDQRAALEWVQRNIGAFGGDPAQVTIWGGSAGGGSVTMQLIAGGAYDLPPFSGAIAEYRESSVPRSSASFIRLTQRSSMVATTPQLVGCSSDVLTV